ncbi:MAG: hypothetical protein KGS72_13750 [Cyanobacteria bacterium REEB67]|nr:hypothetical protein [Cyanobacteria bacterium REEB67]
MSRTEFRDFACALALALSVSLSSAFFLTSRAASPDPGIALSAAELTELLTQPNVGVKATNLQVVGAGPDVTVLAQKESASSERDLKIDAVFLAKALIVAAPKQVSRVKVLFSQAGHDGRFVNISDKQITQYGSGKISAEQFLATLHLVPVEATPAPDLVPGGQYERRLLVWQRIEKLRKSGTGVEPFEALFSEIENTVKSGRDDPGKKLSFLENKLADQEDALAQAKRTARGLGVPASKNSQSGGGGSTVAGALPSFPTGAAGGGSRENQGGQSSQSGQNSQGPIPSDHVKLRMLFRERAENYINIARGKDYKVAEQMVSLKRQIELAFAADRPGQGFLLMRQFQALAKQTSNVDMFAPGESNIGPGGLPEGGPIGGPRGNGGPNGGPP